MNDYINKAILQLRKRAEKYSEDELVRTFVNVGPLFTLLSNPDHQILYGRRGTGKTHIFGYLRNVKTQDGHCPIYVDLRTIGSTGGMYSDSSTPLAERATRLLVDVLSVIHNQILDYALINDEEINLAQIGPVLEGLAESITEVAVIGPVETEQVTESKAGGSSEVGLALSVKDISISAKSSDSEEKRVQTRKSISGHQKHRVHFPSIQSYFKKIIEILRGKELWIIIDEWAEIPLELQPFLADLLRRTVLPLYGASVKIGAIDHRSNFRESIDSADYLGIEIGADVTSLNLDEYMVFDNSDSLAIDFFKELIYKHINPILSDELKFSSSGSFISQTFTQTGAFTEFVRATEGVPRDAINILVNASLKARNEKISMVHIREAARIWYTRDKEKSVSSKENALPVLRWIIDEVISHRNARAFLLQTDMKNDIIDFLYDARVLHLIKQSVAGQDKPGIRYNVFSIDYGCYVDLINTNRAPKGLFQAETDDGLKYVQVPNNDYRAIRRAILDLEEFENSKA